MMSDSIVETVDVLHYLLHTLFYEFLLSLRARKGYCEWLNKLFKCSYMISSFKNRKMTNKVSVHIYNLTCC